MATIIINPRLYREILAIRNSYTTWLETKTQQYEQQWIDEWIAAQSDLEEGYYDLSEYLEPKYAALKAQLQNIAQPLLDSKLSELGAKYIEVKV